MSQPSFQLRTCLSLLELYGIKAQTIQEKQEIVRILQSTESFQVWRSEGEVFISLSDEKSAVIEFSPGFLCSLPGPDTLLFEAKRVGRGIFDKLRSNGLSEEMVTLAEHYGMHLLPQMREDMAIHVYDRGQRREASRAELIQAIYCLLSALFELPKPVITAGNWPGWWESLLHQGYLAGEPVFLPTLEFVARQAVQFITPAVVECDAQEAHRTLERWLPPVLTNHFSNLKNDIPNETNVSSLVRGVHGDTESVKGFSNITRFMYSIYERAAESASVRLREATRVNLAQKPEKYRLTRWEKEGCSWSDCRAFIRSSGDYPWNLMLSWNAGQTEQAFQIRRRQGEDWDLELAPAVSQSMYAALAKLITMPRWEAGKCSGAMLFWRAAARAGAAILEAGDFRATGIADESREPRSATVLLAPSLQNSEVAGMFSELVALAAPFSEQLFGYEFGSYSAKPLETRVYAVLAIATTSICSDALHAKSLRNMKNGVYEYSLTCYPHYPFNYLDATQRAYCYSLVASYTSLSALTMAFDCCPAFRVDRTEDGGLMLKLGFMRLVRQGSAMRFVNYQSANRTEKDQLAALVSGLGKLPDSVCGLFKTENIDHSRLAVKIDPALLAEFIFTAIPRLQRHGFYFDTEESFFTLTKPRVVARVDAGPGLLHGLLDKKALSDFSWQAAIGDQMISRAELDDLLKKAGTVISYAGAFLYFSEEEARAIETQIAARHRLAAFDKLRAVLSGTVKGVEVLPTDTLRERLKAILKAEDYPVPQGLAAKLRPYQQRGYSWLSRNISLGLGALIADDMGLGKTVQVIAAILRMKQDGELEQGRVLVVAPASLLTNWQREVRRFAPALSCEIYHGNDRELAPELARADIVVTSYGIVRRDLAELTLRKWRLLVLDEAQAVKNWNSSQSEAVRLLPAGQVIAMTGTPVENSLSEYWSILSAVQPGLFGGKTEFMRDFGRPIEERMDRRALERFRQLTAPFVLRRVKSDKSIIADLPDKNEIDYFTALTPEQVTLYEQCLHMGLANLQTLEKDAQAQGDAALKAAVQNFKMKRRGSILRMITHMKQICDSPSLFHRSEAAGPDSGKGEALIAFLGPTLEAGNKVLVFTQYAEMGERLQKWIESAGYGRPDFLHGGVPIAERTKMVDRFQQNPQARIMILTLKAGGAGLNLTAASVVIHYDLWWNPASENQATDRAYRIGQDKTVMVYRFITAGTFEEKIDKLLANKKQLASLAVSSGEKWIGDMSDKELEELFRLGL